MNRLAGDITRVQELVYELRIDQVMTRDVITCAPDCPMRDLKELLRIKHIAGVPVLVGRKPVGMISIENVICALEMGEMDATVGQRMTQPAQTVRAQDSVVSAVTLFARLGYGRFPVVDDDGRLVGVITKGDIVRGLLRQMEVEWHAGEAQHKERRYGRLFEDIESDDTALILRYHVKARDFVHGGEASSKIKRALERLGAQPAVLRRVAVAVYEAEVNVMIHSLGGELIAEARPGKLTVTAIDTGPGILDTTRAMEAGYSTAPDWIRELGFGAGMGLSNIKACSDEMRLTSEMGVGTRLEMVFHLSTEAKGAS